MAGGGGGAQKALPCVHVSPLQAGRREDRGGKKALKFCIRNCKNVGVLCKLIPQVSVSSSEPQKSGNWQKGWGKDSRPLQITSFNKYYLMRKKEMHLHRNSSNTEKGLRGGAQTLHVEAAL